MRRYGDGEVDDKEIQIIKKKKMKEMIDKHNSAKTKAREFAQAIFDCEEYKNFIKYADELEKNQTAQNLLKQSQEKQRELQMEINKNEITRNFLKAQDELVDILRRTNDIISGKIRTQFAFLPGGGCCG